MPNYDLEMAESVIAARDLKIDELTDALEQAQVRREELAEGREHLTVTSEFQSDKYPWCPAGFVPLKVTDPMATTLLWAYAGRRRAVDEEFSRDLEEALQSAGDSAPMKPETKEESRPHNK